MILHAYINHKDLISRFLTVFESPSIETAQAIRAFDNQAEAIRLFRQRLTERNFRGYSGTGYLTKTKSRGSTCDAKHSTVLVARQ